MSVPRKYLLLCFVLTWIVWVPGTLLRADVIILTFCSAGPALAAIWLIAALAVARTARPQWWSGSHRNRAGCKFASYS